MKFRSLRADEIECRIGTVKEGSGVSLLLYKDARCDMNILDETVGEMNWKKSYSRENANCTVEIWDANKGQWISKEDTGTESRTEAEKGLASDSFKRACFAWGIGRELYTAPFIWIKGAGKFDRFWVKDMTVENRKITGLTICCCDQYGNRKDDVAFQYPKGKKPEKAEAPEVTPESPITKTMWNSLLTEFKNRNIDMKAFFEEHYNFVPTKMSDINVGFLNTVIADLNKEKS